MIRVKFCVKLKKTVTEMEEMLRPVHICEPNGSQAKCVYVLMGLQKYVLRHL